MQCETITEIAHDIVTICPETDRDGSTTVYEDPDWDGRLGCQGSGAPDEVDSGQRPNGARKN